MNFGHVVPPSSLVPHRNNRKKLYYALVGVDNFFRFIQQVKERKQTNHVIVNIHGRRHVDYLADD